MVANLNLSERQNIYIIAVLFPTSEGNLTDQNDHTALPYPVKDQALISPIITKDCRTTPPTFLNCQTEPPFLSTVHC